MNRFVNSACGNSTFGKRALVVVSMAFFALTAQAASIISEDYDSLALGSPDPNFPSLPGSSTTADTGSLFGAGNDNYLQITDANIGTNITSPDFANDTEILFYSFDFIVAADPSHEEIAMILGDGQNTSDIAVELRVQDNSVHFVGSAGFSAQSISAGGRYRVGVVANTSGDGVTYDAGGLGTQGLANNRFDAYLFNYGSGTGTQFASDATFRADGQISLGPDVEITNLLWRNHASRNVDMKIDNVRIETLTAVPEPASLAMGFVGFSLLMAGRRIRCALQS